MTTELLDSKGIAQRLRRSVWYVYAMRKRGFMMVGGRATMADAIEFLRVHPAPTGKHSNKFQQIPKKSNRIQLPQKK
jgi:hypothetical protein